MGLLDQVVGGLLGGTGGGGGSPIAGVLMSMLGGQQAGGQAGMQQGGQAMPGMGGGIGGIVSMFEQAGLGHIAQSWTGNGANLPVSPQQLTSVFGQGQVQNMASQAGMPQEDFLQQLAQHLPNAVNGMTPSGSPQGEVQV